MLEINFHLSKHYETAVFNNAIKLNRSGKNRCNLKTSTRTVLAVSGVRK